MTSNIIYFYITAVKVFLKDETEEFVVDDKNFSS